MNSIQKIFSITALVLGMAGKTFAAVSCGSAVPGVLNVGILPANLPYSAIVNGQAVGFDPLLIQQIAKLLGYNTVNFIGYGNSILAVDAVLSGAIDIYANSANVIGQSILDGTNLIGVVTDISQVPVATSNVANGYLLNIACCSLALQIEAAITYLVNNGIYAQILQAVRLLGYTGVIGYPTNGAGPMGILQEPAPFNSSEIGTIPASCAGTGALVPIALPATNCISSFVQTLFVPGVTFTGATGPIIT